MIIPCRQCPIEAIESQLKAHKARIAALEAQGGIDLSDYVVQSQLEDYSQLGHDHNDLYYTEAEVDAALEGKADDPPINDDRYYTEIEVDDALSQKSDVGHTHTLAGKQLISGFFVQGGSENYWDGSGVTFQSIPYFQVQISVAVGDVIHADFALGIYCDATYAPSVEGRFYSNLFGVSVRRAHLSSSTPAVWPWSDTLTANILSNGTLTLGYQFRGTQASVTWLIADTVDRYPVMSVLHFR